jgi:hypothetical protein
MIELKNNDKEFEIDLVKPASFTIKSISTQKEISVESETDQNKTDISLNDKQTIFLNVKNESTRSFDIVNKNVFLTQNRQEGLVIRNVNCAVNVFVGAAVYMDDNATAHLAIANDYDKSNVVGIVEQKISTDICDVRFLGLTDKIYVGLDVAKEYYLSDEFAGLLTYIAPTQSGHIRLKLGQPFSTTEFVFVKGERIVKG